MAERGRNLNAGMTFLAAVKDAAPQQGWQCPVCGTVYAWWVSKCREKHSPPSVATATGPSTPSEPADLSVETRGVTDA